MQLYPHQKEIVSLSGKHTNLALLWEMGTGKTGAIISILKKKFGSKKILPTLILTPQVTLYNWKEEFKKFSDIPEDKVIVINKTGIARNKLLLNSVGNKILLLNWEALNNDDTLSILMNWGPKVLVGDEMHLIKNFKAKRSKRAVRLSDLVRNTGGSVYGLTGTAILNSAQDIFMQYRFLDGGKLFGTNFYPFRNIYLYGTDIKWINGRHSPTKWVLRPEKSEEVYNKIYSIATRVTKAECLDLPPLIKTKRYVELGTEQRKMYKDMKDQFITFIKNKQKEGEPRAAVANLAVTKGLRLMQIVSGHITDEEGKVYEIKKNPRIDAVEALLEELTPNYKVIIWCSFKNNYKVLGELCDKMGIKHVFLTGEQSAKEKEEAARLFQEDGFVRVIIANRRAGGIGINLTAAAYSIIFSRNFSLGEEKQSEARNHRGGSEIHSRIVKIDLVAKGTIDEPVLKALENKQQISDLIMDWSSDEL